MKKIKNSDFQNLTSFQDKCKRAFKGNCKSYCCLRYYSRHTRDSFYTTKKVFEYIDEFYSKLRCKDDISCQNRSKQLYQLINRYDSLYYQSKVSFSIISSVIISMMVTLIFCFLQQPDQSGMDYFSSIQKICSMLENIGSVIESLQIKQLVIFVFTLILMLLLCLLVLIVLAVLVIIAVKYIYLLSTSMRLIVIPYEREVIAKTISTYNKKLGENIKSDF